MTVDAQLLNGFNHPAPDMRNRMWKETNGNTEGHRLDDGPPFSVPHQLPSGIHLVNSPIKQTISHGKQPLIPVAICSMAMRLPGAVTSEKDFWSLLTEGRDGRCQVPASRYNVEGFHSKGRPSHGYFLNHVDLTRFDAGAFSMTRNEVEKMDPQHRLLLELVREALESAGETEWRGTRTGVYVGTFGEDWLEIQSRDPEDTTKGRVTGYGDYLLANRISYEYDFNGPSVTVKSACSSSLVALDMAFKALQNGEIEAAIVGGANLIMNPRMTSALHSQGVLSPNGTCKTFSADVDGYARGEALNVLYIKRLPDAVKKENPIRAVIRSTATNSDGKTAGIAQPGSNTQEALIRTCYAAAGINDVGNTAFVECHGTGTPIGDPLEAAAVASVFGDRGIYIGSVKPNIGHSEGAAGLSSVIKTVLALEHKVIPPNINFGCPNPQIPFKQAKLVVPVKVTPWPAGRHERVSINSFGIGGANAHVILDSAESFASRLSRARGFGPKLLVFTGSTGDSVQQGSIQCQQYVSTNPGKLQDLAYTLGVRRQHYSYRSFAVADGINTPTFSSPSKTPKLTPKIVYVFTGQGAQWATMGMSLISDYPSVLHDMAQMDNALSELTEPPSWKISDELRRPKDESRIDKAEICQPLCTAIQIVIVNLLRSWGLPPVAVVGHSSGEVAAAYASGALSLKEAIVVAYLRGLAFTKQTIRPGAMAAVGLGRDDVRPFLIDGIVVACENSPISVTLSGDEEKMDTVLETIKRGLPDVFARRLRVEMAYHSPHMRETGAQFERMLGSYLCGSTPKVPFFSSQTNEVIQRKDALNGAYWRWSYDHPVLFHTALEKVLVAVAPSSILLEIGPHSALAGPIRQIIKTSKADAFYVPTLLRGDNATCNMLTAAGQLFSNGIKVDFRALNPVGRVLVDLPTYPWHHKTHFWHESRLSQDYRQRRFPKHEILGSRVHDCSNLEPVWRNVLRLDDVPWCADHVMDGHVIFPGAGYIAMAGEAMRQVSGSNDYTMRDVTLSAALSLQQETEVEVLFAMRPLRLTVSLDSSWFEFTITSHNRSNDTWTKHCAGQVRPGGEHLSEHSTICSFPRKMQASCWYRKMKQVGMTYGPRFQGLDEISAHPVRPSATASVSNTIMEDESVYQLHPTAIDSCIQLFTVAACRGLARRFGNTPVVPTRFGKVFVKRPNAMVTVQADANTAITRGIEGSCYGVAANELVLVLEDVKLSPLGDGDSLARVDPHAGVCLRWKPDIDFEDVGSLIQSDSPASAEILTEIQHLVLLGCLEARHRVEQRGGQRTWLDADIDQLVAEGDIISQAEQLISLSSAERLAILSKVASRIHKTGASPIARAVWNTLDAISRGENDSVDMTSLSTIISNFDDCRSLLQSLSHSKPHLKILEIGTGDRRATAAIIRNLSLESGERSYGSYTYATDSSTALEHVKESFRHVPGMSFTILDIHSDPIEQGFQPASFDLLIATHLPHQTDDLRQGLLNISKLLKSNGKLLVQAPSFRALWYKIIMHGTSKSLATVNEWKEVLSMSGFDGKHATIADNGLCTTTFASLATQIVPDKPHVSLLCQDPNGHVPKMVSMALEKQGFAVDFVKFADDPTQDVISILDFEQNSGFFECITSQNYGLFNAFVMRLQASSGILWLTKACQMRCTDPQFAQIIGLARTLRSELALDVATIELDGPVDDVSVMNAVCQVYRKFRQRPKDQDTDAEYEYAFANGKVHIPRYYWFSVTDSLASESPDGAQAKRLEVGKKGSLKSLQWIPQAANTELIGNEVTVQVQAVGMNFKDILMAMGIIEGARVEANGLGCECTGIVQQVGPDVRGLMVGDRVCIAAPHTYATLVSTTSDHCAKMPDDLSFEDGATMPCVYGTVIHGLLDLAGLERGQTVLIHSACGGIGIAAINICRMVGAKVYATVGSEEKIEYLERAFHLPRNHIFSSRDATFMDGVMRETAGKGVDVALNSLSGDLLHTTWKCVAEFGSMVEIGKRDFMGQGRLSMDLFEPNRSFFGVDLAHMYTDRPKKIRSLLNRIMTFYRDGAIQPIRPTRCFDAVEIEDAYRSLQKGQHIGKLVVRMPADHTLLPAAKPYDRLRLRPDASYLIVGGLGGLGRGVATWLAEHGARNLIFLSRSGMGKNLKASTSLVEELTAMGCDAQIFAGSVTSLEDVRRTIVKANKPIAGVIQMSMVLRDAAFAQMTHRDWEEATAPKVQGTWNLHTAFAEHKLEFMVLFASISGSIGNPGQANYAAANTFLDAFVQFRHHKGLAASVLDIGVMGDVGYVSQDQAMLNYFSSRAAWILEEQDLLDSLQLAIKRSIPEAAAANGDDFVNPSQIGIGVRMTKPVLSPENRATWKRDIRMSAYRNLEQEMGSETTSSTCEGDDKLNVFLEVAASDPQLLLQDSSIVLVAEQVGTTLLSFMMKPSDELDVSLSPAAMGIDSLVATELRTWLRQRLRLEVSVLEIIGAASIHALSKSLLKGLLIKFGTVGKGV